MSNATSSSGETDKRNIFVWREQQELSLLREILTYEPYQYRFASKERGAAWTAIAAHLDEQGMKVNQSSVRERFTRMLTTFKKKEAVEKRASGVDVEYTEKDQALMDIMERMAEFEEIHQETGGAKEKDDKASAEEMRKKAVERLGETRKRRNAENEGDDTERTPDRKRRRSSDIVEVLKDSVNARKIKDEAEQGIRERELDLRERQLVNQQQLQQNLMEQQQQLIAQQQTFTMSMMTTLAELVNKLKS